MSLCGIPFLPRAGLKEALPGGLWGVFAEIGFHLLPLHVGAPGLPPALVARCLTCLDLGYVCIAGSLASMADSYNYAEDLFKTGCWCCVGTSGERCQLSVPPSLKCGRVLQESPFASPANNAWKGTACFFFFYLFIYFCESEVVGLLSRSAHFRCFVGGYLFFHWHFTTPK